MPVPALVTTLYGSGTLEAGTCVSILGGHKDYVSSTEWSPDQSWVLSGSEDCSVRLWDVETRECLRIFQGHTADVRCVEWGADQHHAISGDAKGRIRRWDLTEATK